MRVGLLSAFGGIIQSFRLRGGKKKNGCRLDSFGAQLKPKANIYLNYIVSTSFYIQLFVLKNIHRNVI